MKYRQLGKTNLEVSEIALGSYLTYGDAIDETLSKRCIQTAYEQGINFYDTACSYAGGEGERVLAQALKAYPRDSYVISTKCFFPRDSAEAVQGLSKSNIISSLQGSLKIMNLDYIDVLLCHRFDEKVPLEESIDALNSLIKQGLIRFWGVSRWENEQMLAADAVCQQHAFAKPVCNQYFYNMLNRKAENIFPVCEQLGMSIVAYSPLAQGVLTGKYVASVPEGSRGANSEFKKSMWHLSEADLLRSQEYANEAESEGLKLNHYALKWCLKPSVIASALIGASKPEQVIDNCKASA